MGRSVTRAAAQQRDIIQLALGDISIDDGIEGVPASLYAQYLKTGIPRTALTQQEMDRRIDAIDADNAVATVLPEPLAGNTVAEKSDAFLALQRASSADVEALNSSQLEFTALASSLHGSQYEAQLVGGQWLTSVAGLSPETSLSDGVLDSVSPLRAASTRAPCALCAAALAR